MHAAAYKKMAGTAAVFLSTEFDRAAPVERDGMVWTAEELHLDKLPAEHHRKPMMQTVLALEGLEEYDKPANGDLRCVDALGSDFLYFQQIGGWVQLI